MKRGSSHTTSAGDAHAPWCEEAAVGRGRLQRGLRPPYRRCRARQGGAD